jgi:ADP-heptose:LPS heptosyltransferase
MIKKILRRVLLIGVSPWFLVIHVAMLRALHRLPKARVRSLTTVKSILYSFPYHTMGDPILSLTLLDCIHDRWPDAQIDVVVGSLMGDLISTVPYVRRVFKLHRTRLRRFPLVVYAEMHNVTKLFRKEISGIEYDFAIAPRWNSNDSFISAYMAYLTGAAVRCGYSGTCDGGSADVDILFTVAATGGMGEHESLRYTRLLSRCGLASADSDDSTRSQRPIQALQNIAESCRHRNMLRRKIDINRYAVLAPGATSQHRMWPTARFAEVGSALNTLYGFQAIIVGGRADIGLCKRLSVAIGKSALSVAGETNPLEMLDIIANAKLFVGNDSGPAHIAGGLGISTVVVSPFPASSSVEHINSPRRFCPVGPCVHVLQPDVPLAPCSPTCQKKVQHCILQVSSGEVLAVVRSLVEQNRSL